MENLVDGDPTTIAITNVFSWLKIEKYSSKTQEAQRESDCPPPQALICDAH